VPRHGKEISVNAFYANTPGQNWIGLWSHPRSHAMRYTSLDFWIEVAEIAERGLFDSIFFADTSGVYDVYEGSPRAAIERAAMFPMNDPMFLIPTMAHVTKHLSFGVTGNLTYNPPFLLARKFSTLDHLTDGRISWNIVTGFQDSAARAIGLPQQREHDERYDVADDYMEVVYKLWEGSWEDGAVVRDVDRRIYADAARVHRVTHQGPHFRMSGVHMSEPSPQRTPVLYQAGGSARGRAFAARHAECIFLSGLAKETTAERVRAIKEQARAEGRDPGDIRFIMMATVIVAPTEAEARDKHAELARYVEPEGMMALYSGLSGVDLAKHAPDDAQAQAESRGIKTVLESYSTANPKRDTRTFNVGRFGPQGGRECFLVGSPVQVADELEAWMKDAELDGFNLQRSGEPDHLIDFIDLVVPELQNRGVYKTAYRDGTFRKKLFGQGDRLPDRHPAARHRIAL
jgi:FMN-dependent oxidoreductase (nitrilotriacetate monooxygenase family)